jgi:hypothetical protein
MTQAIEALRQGAEDNPTSAAYPAALGQAQLYRAGEVASNGGTISEMGILGMQADQSFDAALKLDAANWEAQFFKPGPFMPLMRSGDLRDRRDVTLANTNRTGPCPIRRISQPSSSELFVEPQAASGRERSSALSPNLRTKPLKITAWIGYNRYQ